MIRRAPAAWANRFYTRLSSSSRLDSSSLKPLSQFRQIVVRRGRNDDMLRQLPAELLGDFKAMVWPSNSKDADHVDKSPGICRDLGAKRLTSS